MRYAFRTTDRISIESHFRAIYIGFLVALIVVKEVTIETLSTSTRISVQFAPPNLSLNAIIRSIVQIIAILTLRTIIVVSSQLAVRQMQVIIALIVPGTQNEPFITSNAENINTIIVSGAVFNGLWVDFGRILNVKIWIFHTKVIVR